MKQFARLCVVMAGVLALPAVPSRATLAFTPDFAGVASPGWIARGGGGGGGGGGGRGGGGFSGGGGHSGFSGAGSANGLNRGANRPQGGWAENSRGHRGGAAHSGRVVTRAAFEALELAIEDLAVEVEAHVSRQSGEPGRSGSSPRPPPARESDPDAGEPLTLGE